jgi:alpha-glucoside transport system permease protein
LFLAPALVLLGAIVVYPTIDTIGQSFQNADRQWVGFENYQTMLETDRMVTAIKNNAIWVATAPAIITGLGLMFAILTERVRYQTAIKIIVFMPMAISFLATGVIWRLMYEESPQLGAVNAAIKAASDVTGGAGELTGAKPSQADAVEVSEDNAVTTKDTAGPGDVVTIGLSAIAPDAVPEGAEQAVEPEAGANELAVVVWRDFKPGGGEPGVVEEEELGLPNTTVELVDDSGEVVATQTTDSSGAAVFTGLSGDAFQVRVAAGNFATGFTGISWLGPSLVTPAIIGAFSWMWAGFAVVVIGAGLAALPRDVLEAARVDGANEWQTFRHVTLPLLMPVLGVVFVTLVINVLKIFDIVLVTAPGQSVDEANVIALEMWKTSFQGGQQGVGAAIAVVLFLLVVPVMFLNIKRFRGDQ